MKIHHSAICTRDIDASVRFWRDGLGFVQQMDQTFEGDWPTLFQARAPELRSVFLGDPADTTGGLVELVEFPTGIDDGTPDEGPHHASPGDRNGGRPRPERCPRGTYRSGIRS